MPSPDPETSEEAEGAPAFLRPADDAGAAPATEPAEAPAAEPTEPDAAPAAEPTEPDAAPAAEPTEPTASLEASAELVDVVEEPAGPDTEPPPPPPYDRAGQWHGL